MRERICIKALLAVMVICVLNVCMITGCGEEEVSDSNTSRVENVRRDGTEGKGQGREGVSAYIPMKEIKKEVVKILGENYWPDKQLTIEELEVETGIKEEMIDDYLAEKLNVETDIDAMIILKVKQVYMEEIEMLLNEYREGLMVKFKDRPQELGKVQASRIEVIDNYICFVQLGADTSMAAKEGDEEVLALCQQENERALDRIEKTILNQ